VPDSRWLREQLYQHGRKFQSGELVMRATGGPMPYLAYLCAKYEELYRLPTIDKLDQPATDSAGAPLEPLQARRKRGMPDLA
jgi:hypothetical protein